MLDLSFFRGKRVFVTGHTGFKGAWLCRILVRAGAELYGYSLAPAEPSLFELLGLEGEMTSFIGDVRDIEHLERCFAKARPEIVFHLAAQPIVSEGYKEPRYTYETNVMGTVNILECVRKSRTVRSFLNVTTDKVYKNDERESAFCEDDLLDGFDPYSNSKSCSELVTHSYKNSFFADGRVAISCARAGNAIGGGDFSWDRIIPHCVMSISESKSITLRSPRSVRPYQHVLEALFAYLLIAERQYEDASLSGYYNVGPDEGDTVETRELVRLFCESFGSADVSFEDVDYHEAGVLKLDSTKLKDTFGWSPIFSISRAIEYAAEWYRVYISGGDVKSITDRQIDEFSAAAEWIK